MNKTLVSLLLCASLIPAGAADSGTSNSAGRMLLPALSQFAAEEDLSDVVLLIDEAHNLVERGRSYLSPELSARTARRWFSSSPVSTTSCAMASASSSAQMRSTHSS